MRLYHALELDVLPKCLLVGSIELLTLRVVIQGINHHEARVIKSPYFHLNVVVVRSRDLETNESAQAPA